MTKEQRRKRIAEAIVASLDTVKESRLLELLGQAVKYQEIKGLIKSNIQLDVFLDKTDQKQYHDKDEYFSQISKTLAYPVESCINATCFSHNGSFLVTGAQDGIIEVLDSMTQKLKLDLVYQQEQAFMVHSSPITSLSLSRDNEILASGDAKGYIKIWKLQSGKMLKKFHAFQSYVSQIRFGKDISHVLVASDFIQLFGLKSGSSLKSFKSSNKSMVVDFVQFNINARQQGILSAQNDGTITIWDFVSTEALHTFVPQTDTPGKSMAISTLIPVSNDDSQYMICNQEASLSVVSPQGQTLRKFSIDREEYKTEFTFAAVSPKRQWAYGLGKNNVLYCFNMNTGKLESTLKVAEKDQEIKAIMHNPVYNQLILYTNLGVLNFLMP